jgi:hypothetical protein
MVYLARLRGLDSSSDYKNSLLCNIGNRVVLNGKAPL